MSKEKTPKQYRGTGGGRPDPSAPMKSKFEGPVYVLEEQVGDGTKKVVPFMIKQGTQDVPVVVLDSNDLDYAVLMHSRFKLNGSWSNYVVCTKKSDPKGCPVCAVAEKPSQWFLCGSLIDRSKWTIPNGKNKGQVRTDQRRLLLITASQVDTMEMIGGKIKTWRGASFDVGRSEDQKSPRIGSNWFFTSHMSEQDILETFEGAAATYGYTPEQYTAPFDYESILKPLSYKELTKIAEEIRAETEGATAAATATSMDDIPF